LSQEAVDRILLENVLLNMEIFSFVVIIILLIIYWKRSDDRKFLRMYTIYVVMILLFIFSHIILHLNEAVHIKERYFIYVKWVSFPLAEVTCLILCWSFLNRTKKFNYKMFLFYIIPLIYTVLMLTNNLHETMASINNLDINKTKLARFLEFSTLFSCMPLIIIVFRKLLSQRGYNLKQGIIIIISGVVPGIIYVCTVIFHIDFIPKLTFDLAPLASGITMVFFGFGALKYRLLNLIPIGFKEFAENIGTAFLIIDRKDTILYCNKTMKETFDFQHINEKRQPLDDFFLHIKDFISDDDMYNALKDYVSSESNSEFELVFQKPHKRYFRVTADVIIAFEDEVVGKLLSFKDVTDFKKLMLSHVDLAVVRTKNEIYKEAHDTIGNAMSLIIMCLQNDLANISKDELGKRENTVRALKIAREKYGKFREMLYGNIENNTFIKEQGIQKVLTKLKDIENDLEGNVALNIKFGDVSVIDDAEYSNKIYNIINKVILEGVTNSVKHGLAKNIDIFLKESEGFIFLNVIDDGIGCENINYGIGLFSMKDAISEINGSINFMTNENDGFGIFVKIPLR